MNIFAPNAETNKDAAKILMVTTSYPRHHRDVSGIFVQNLAEALVDQGTDTAVLAPSDADVDHRFDRSSKVHVLRFRYFIRAWELFFNRPAGGLPQRFKTFSPALLLLPFAAIGILWKTFWAVRRFDIIHCHWFPTAIFAVLPARVWRKRLVITVHGSDSHFLARHWLGRRLMQFVFSRAERVISVNELFVDWLAETYPRLAGRATFIPNGTRLAAETLGTNRKIDVAKLLFVGNLVKDKGLLELRTAIEDLLREGTAFQLTLIGAPPPKSLRWIYPWIAQYHQYVKYRGVCPQLEVLAAMKNHDLLILPTYHEGRCNVIMEAMANGLPILTTAIPSTLELLTHARDAYLVPPQDAAALSQGVQWCIHNADRMREFAGSARMRLLMCGHTWEQAAVAHGHLYRQVLAA